MLGSEQESFAQRQPQLGRTERIAALNDTLRKLGQGGKVVVTRGVLDLIGADVFLSRYMLNPFRMERVGRTFST